MAFRHHARRRQRIRTSVVRIRRWRRNSSVLLPQDAGRRSARHPDAGALNMHGLLLPKYRGRVPVNWAVLHGERETAPHCTAWRSNPTPAILVADGRAHPGDDTAHEVFQKVTVAAELTRRGAAATDYGTAPSVPPDLKAGSYFGPQVGRWPHRLGTAHGRRGNNLVRAVAPALSWRLRPTLVWSHEKFRSLHRELATSSPGRNR